MSTINYVFTLIGDTGTGKKYFLKKLSNPNCLYNKISITGVIRNTINFNLDVCDKKGKIEKKQFYISIFITPGIEKFRSISCSYFRNSNGILFVYDITRYESFESVVEWIEDLIENTENSDESKYAIVLIGNKLDLVKKNCDKRDVEEKDAIQMCEKYDIIWGGEQSFTKLDSQGCIELLAKYTGEIYKKLGKLQPKLYREKNQNQNHIHALNKYISF